jgi:hypothetical protein
MTFSLNVLGESDAPSLPVWRIFLSCRSRVFSLFFAIFDVILAQIYVFYNCMNTFNTAKTKKIAIITKRLNYK